MTKTSQKKLDRGSRADYMKKWKVENKERLRAYNKEYNKKRSETKKQIKSKIKSKLKASYLKKKEEQELDKIIDFLASRYNV